MSDKMNYNLSISENGKKFISEKGDKDLKELIEYCRENPEKAEAFFKIVNTSSPAEIVFIYGPTCRIINITFKHGPRGWSAFKRVYKKNSIIYWHQMI